MKLITAVIKPIRLETVCSALEKAGFAGLTVTDVQGRGVQAGRTEFYRGQAYSVEFRTKVRLELLVDDERLDLALGTILDAARTGGDGELGDGKVWVTEVLRAIRVRTGELDAAAI